MNITSPEGSSLIGARYLSRKGRLSGLPRAGDEHDTCVGQGSFDDSVGLCVQPAFLAAANLSSAIINRARANLMNASGGFQFTMAN
ncbi:hypothetical protein [Rhizobium bangladeshense]|uniref:hypothetical protein n=1 Tax=Rhizobium bangladeshense TaxID=1138189 RepID=UPI001C83C537|nr:hypothetical protein [Rhizobium bangladeshense]MBX4917901.1 hypothetical protein [Rhizobium bangladeshense]MBX4922971.1 hypothetical protein [Rhizobium bangladeshense]